MRMLGLLLCCSSLCLTACPGDDGPAGDATDGPTSTGSAGSTGSTGPTTSEPVTITSDSTTTAGSSDSGPGTGTMDDTSSGSAGSETGTATCDFADTLDMFAQGKLEPVNCGDVTLEDDAATWEAAWDCAQGAAGIQDAFRVGFQLPSIDSTIYEGFYGAVGITYSLGRLYYDSYGDPVLVSNSCTDVVAVPGCEPDVGQHCLECVDAGESTPLECAQE